MLKDILKSRVVKNASWIVAGRILQMCINLIVGLLTARYLGPANYGLINYASAYTVFFMAFCTLGINSVLVKEFTDKQEDEGLIIGTSLVLRGISSICSIIIIIGIVNILDSNENLTIQVVTLYSIGLIFQIFEVINYWFQSKLNSKVTAIIGVIVCGIISMYKVVLLVYGKSVLFFALTTSIDYLCVAIFLLLAYKKHNGNKLSFSKQYGKQLLKKSCHFILPSLMIAIYGQTDKIMLKQLMGETEIGYYSIAISLCNVWCFVLVAIIDSVYPSIMNAYNKCESLFNKRNRQLYACVFYISIFVSMLITILAEPVIRIMYGNAYLPAVNPLRVITWYTAFSYLGVARNAWIVCKNRQKYLIYVYMSAAIANVFLNYLLIPHMGAVGASIASLIAQIITTLVAPFFIKDLKENSVIMIEAIMLKDITIKRLH